MWIFEALLKKHHFCDEEEKRRPTNGKRKLNDKETKEQSDAESKNPAHSNYIRDKIQSSAFRRMNDALFYPDALRWGVVELACAAIDLAIIENFGIDSSHNHATCDSDLDTATGQSPGKKNNTAKKIHKDCMRGLIAIFPKDWWKEYEVSKQSLDDCKRNLKEAAQYLRSIDATARHGSDTVETKKPS